MCQAFDFALDKMGMDFTSYSLWTDYILFLKNVDVVGSYAENQKISAIRKIYHRGIIIPMLNVENLWYEKSSKLNSLDLLYFTSILGKIILRSSRESIQSLLRKWLERKVEITWQLVESLKNMRLSRAASISHSWACRLVAPWRKSNKYSRFFKRQTSGSQSTLGSIPSTWVWLDFLSLFSQNTDCMPWSDKPKGSSSL